MEKNASKPVIIVIAESDKATIAAAVGPPRPAQPPRAGLWISLPVAVVQVVKPNEPEARK